MTSDRISLSPELLVAYADGELAPGEAAAVADALRQDETAHETLRRLRQSADLAAQAHADVIDEPVPGRLVDAARGRAILLPMTESPSRGRLLPLAAGITTLFLGLAGGYVLRGAHGGYASGGYAVAAAATSDALAATYEATLQGALESGTSRQTFTYESQGLGKGAITLGQDFTTSSGAHCYEFSRRETRGTMSKTDNGIACRGGDGSWSVMTLAGAP